MNRNKKLAKNTIIYFIGNISTKLISFLLLPLYTSYLSPEDYGKVDLVFTYTSIIIPIITLQITFAAFRYLFDAKNYDEQREIISSTFLIYLLGMGIFSIFYSVIWSIFKFEFGMFVIIYLLLNSFSSMLQQLARGLGKNIVYATTGVISTTIQLVCNIVFIVGLNLRSTALLLSPTIGFIASIIYILVTVKIHKYFRLNLYTKKTIKKMLQYSIPLVPDAICWWLLLGFGRIFLSYTNGIQAVGIYAVANKFPSFLTMFYSIFNLAWQENSFSEYDKDDRDTYYSTVYNHLFKFIVPLVNILIPISKIIIPIMLGIQFEEAYLYIPILYLSVTLDMLSTFYASGFESAKKTGGILVSTLIAMSTNIIFNMILTQKIGVLGVSIAMVASYSALFIFRIITSKKFFTIKVEKNNAIILSVLMMLNISLYYINSLILQLVIVLFDISIFIIFNLSFIKVIFVKVKGKFSIV